MLDPETQDAIHHLWDDLSDFEAGAWPAATGHLLARLAALVSAGNATWAGAIRVPGAASGDALQGWRVGAVSALHPVAPHDDEGHFKEILRVWERREIDPSFLLPLKDVGAFRTYAFRRDLPADWFESVFFQRFYQAVGTQDAVFVAFPLNEDCESHFGFYGPQPFSQQQIACLAYALRGIKWFHRHLLLGNGLLLASQPLTPAERRVLQLLLTKASEKEISRQLAIALSTAHEHVTRIFRKYGVRSRAELMTLWLNKGR